MSRGLRGLIFIVILSFFLIPTIGCTTYHIYPIVNATIFTLIGNLTKQNKTIQPGDIIQYHKGLYTHMQYTTQIKGTSKQHITIKGENGVVIENGLYFTSFEYVDFLGPFEIRNTKEGYVGSGYGISVRESKHITIKNFYIHHTWQGGIVVKGDDIIVSNNRIYESVQMNVNASANSWGQCITAGNTNILVENNTITECWGDGIDLIYCQYCTARRNTIRNAHSVMLYIDNSANLLIENNLLYITRYDFTKSYKATAFGIGTETHGNINATNITYRNNLAVNCGHSFFKMGGNGYYADIRMIHNTFYNSSLALQFTAVKDPTRVKNIYLANNILTGNENVKDGTNQVWTSHSNIWIVPPGTWRHPLEDSKKYANTSISLVEKIENVLFRKLLENPLCHEPECFMPLCPEEITNKSFIDLLTYRGLPTPYSNNVDFFGEKRDKSHPTIGFSEFCYRPKESGMAGWKVFLIVVFVIVVIAFVLVLVIVCLKKKGIVDNAFLSEKISSEYFHKLI